MANLKRLGKCMIMDFDSTFIKLEALDNLAEIALLENPQKEKIIIDLKEITKLGMEGKITFPQSLSRRLNMFSATKQHVEELIDRLKNNVSDSIIHNKSFFQKNSSNIYIISGGFIDYIMPIVREFGIEQGNVLANKFIYSAEDRIIGIDEKCLLAQERGKAKAVKALNLKNKAWVVGDGWTDLEIKKAGYAKKFVAFVENVSRDSIVKNADLVISNMDQLIQALEA